MKLKNLIINATSMFYKEDDWIVMTFWNSLYIAFFLLPLGINLPTPFFVISIIFGVIMMFRSDKSFILDNKILLLFPAYFVVMSLGLIYTDNLSSGFDLIQRSLTLLLFPIIFLFVKEDATTVRKLFDFLLVGLLVSFCFNFFCATNNLLQYAINGKEAVNTFSFIERLIKGRNYFFIGSSLSRAVNANYISIYILLVLSYYLKNKLQTRLQMVVIFVLFLYLFLLASIAAYVILAIMAILLIVNIKDKQKKYTMIIMFMMGVFLFASNPRVSDFYVRIKSFNETLDYENTTSEKSRVLSWDASIKLIKEAPFLGYGVGDANDVLIKKYKELNYTFNHKNKYNSHNQFLQTYLQTGIVGFGILVSIFILLGMRMKRSKNEFSVFLILFISLLFESMLVRFNGIVFFSIVIPLLLKKRSILSSRIIRNE
ncbi:O-antigen ligase [Aquimarina sp. I32.4]|uniref:O-antigen ligase family protein n=1 Tax=Aquimarina sp. I32.4 TaxID=2053903 RepID=UPI0011AFA93E|nr:O-antigen ligase family protein [Aquimarina sp. I32.4]